ncbi:MAG: hypothetical protein ACE15F_15860 [bacterium]
MDESNTNLQENPGEDIRNKGSSRGTGWGILWVMLIGFGGVAYYIDARLTSLESRVLSQTGDVSKQTENTLQAIQNARKDILGNRAESAEFAQKFSTTLTDMSALVTQSVQAFTRQTSELTQAIEAQDQNQKDALQTLAATLAQDTAATREAAVQAKDQVQAVDQQLAALARRVEQNGQDLRAGVQQLSQDFMAGLTSMSEWSQQANLALSSRLDEQAKTLNTQLTALREDSRRSLDNIETQLAGISTDTQSGRTMLETLAHEGLAQITGILDGYAESQRIDTQGVETALGNQVDALMDTLHAGQMDQKTFLTDWQTRIDGQIQALADDTQFGFAGGKESVEILRNDIREMEYALSGRTEDLWLELAALKQIPAQPAEPNRETLAAGMESLSQSLAGLADAVADTRSLAASSREMIQQWISTESRRDQDFAAALEIQTQTRLAMESARNQLGDLGQRVEGIHGDLAKQLNTVQETLAAQSVTEGTEREEYSNTIKGLQTLSGEIQTLHGALKTGIEAARSQAAAWMENPESEEARAAFQTILDDMAKSIQATQDQVEAIQKEISSLAAQLTPAGAEPIGMAPVPATQEASP